MVWQCWDGAYWQIFFFDGVLTRQLTDTTGDNIKPQIDKDGKLVWQGWDGSHWQVYYWDPTTAITQRLSDGTSDAVNPYIPHHNITTSTNCTSSNSSNSSSSSNNNNSSNSNNIRNNNSNH